METPNNNTPALLAGSLTSALNFGEDRMQHLPAPEWDTEELPRRYWQHSGVPERHAEALANLADPAGGDERAGKWAKALEAVRGALAGGGIVALLGNRGSGKTLIATALIQESCLLHRTPALYRRAGDIFATIRATYDGRGTSEAAILDRLGRCGLLVIDEAHERAGSDFESRTLTRLLDARYMAHKPTLLVSNEQPEAFSDSIGPSIADRLREDGKIILACWESFRRPLGSIVQRIE